MQVTLNFCNDARAEPDGSLSIIRIFNELYAPDFPAKQDRVVLAGVLEWDRECDGDQSFLIHLKDPDGDPIFTIEGHSPVDRRAPDRPPARSHLILPMENVIFPTDGQYSIEATVNDRVFRGPSLYLMRHES